MATVYLAQDLRQERLVALKVIHPELTATMGSERFLREIKLTANLRHPHILPLFDSGEAGGQLRVDHLQRDQALLPEVLCQVDRGHAPASELALDAVTVGQSVLQAGCGIAQWVIPTRGLSSQIKA
jgi:serine/threonine protein kinase